MEYVPRHLRRSEMSEKKVNNSKYMNELDNSEMCIYVGGDRRWAEVRVVRECPLTTGKTCYVRRRVCVMAIII